MSGVNNSKSETLNSSETVIHGQTNPSFHDTPEDSKNYKSLQTKPQTTVKKPLFLLKPSILTQKAEELRTDKVAVKSNSSNLGCGNKFLVLGNERKTERTELSLTEETAKVEEPTKGFVFGQNISDRVVSSEGNPDAVKGAQEFKDLAGDGAELQGNGEVDSDALRKNAEVATQKNTTSQQLQEAEVITGEEDELSVLKLSCKVFLFSNERQEWVEKGYCFVHVNETDNISTSRKSRLVVRSKGGLKVVINTFIFAEMVLTKASDKSLRISAQSEDGVKSYLLTMLNINDADILYHELSRRKMTATLQSGGKITRKRDLSSSENDEDEYESKKRMFSDDDE